MGLAASPTVARSRNPCAIVCLQPIVMDGTERGDNPSPYTLNQSTCIYTRRVQVIYKALIEYVNQHQSHSTPGSDTVFKLASESVEYFPMPVRNYLDWTCIILGPFIW